ncbi:MAG: carboxypeptidase-like regulatory domain-containing protein [Ferruginibacter sp.]
MKLTAVCMLAFCLQVSARGFSQDKISMKLQNEEIEDAISTIEKRTSYRFIYNGDLAEIKQKVSISVNEAAIAEVMQLLLKNAGLTFEMINDHLIAIKKDGPEETEQSIIGKVTNEQGQPMANVSITVKNETGGATTNDKGTYSINVKGASSILVFSYVGYVQQEITVGSRKSIDITLKDTESKPG